MISLKVPHQESSCCAKACNGFKKHGLKMVALACVVAQVALLTFYSLPLGLASAGLWLAMCGIRGLVSLRNRSIQAKILMEQAARPQQVMQRKPAPKPADPAVLPAAKWVQQNISQKRQEEVAASKAARRTHRGNMYVDMAIARNGE
jgi:hypothetical protein